MYSVGAKGAESGGKERQIRRPFHPDYYFLRIHNPGEMAAETRSSQAPTADHSPLLFGGTYRASWLYIRHNSIVESSGQTLAPVTVSVLSLPGIGEDDPVMVDISNAVVKQLSPSGVKYRCELEPLWLAADLVEKAKM